jgi:hypothetical protein
MTEKQRNIFSEILDLNFEMNSTPDAMKQYDLMLKLNTKKKELEEDMGKKEYRKFMNAGTQMFAKKSNDEN